MKALVSLAAALTMLTAGMTLGPDDGLAAKKKKSYTAAERKMLRAQAWKSGLGLIGEIFTAIAGSGQAGVVHGKARLDGLQYGVTDARVGEAAGKGTQLVQGLAGCRHLNGEFGHGIVLDDVRARHILVPGFALAPGGDGHQISVYR